MSPRAKVPRLRSPTHYAHRAFKNRDGLGEYILEPTSWPSSVVIYHNDDFVVIHDRYPKATVHTLLLPRSEKHNLLHPFDAFEDAEFLAKIREEAEKLKSLVAKELQRILGPDSRLDAAREQVLNGTKEPADGVLPDGRDWESEVMVGVHAVPSMSHLHVHVLSRDMHSSCVKHRKHYNSFNTPFLVHLADLPLSKLDPRRSTGEHGYLKRDFKCWRCGKNFKNQFKQLKDHLEEEFQAWKKL